MRRASISLILVTTGLFGCDDGAQHGKYSVGGSSSRTFANVAGSLTIVRGEPQPFTQQSAGQQPLLYILTLAPSLTISGSGFSGKDGSSVSEYKETWQTAKGPVSVELSWDRRTDKVMAGGMTFDRLRGNVFVLVRGPSGAVTATQAGPLNAGFDEPKALPQVQALLPAGSPAKNMALVP